MQNPKTQKQKVDRLEVSFPTTVPHSSLFIFINLFFEIRIITKIDAIKVNPTSMLTKKQTFPF